jgi:hypothetical protein
MIARFLRQISASSIIPPPERSHERRFSETRTSLQPTRCCSKPDNVPVFPHCRRGASPRTIRRRPKHKARRALNNPHPAVFGRVCSGRPFFSLNFPCPLGGLPASDPFLVECDKRGWICAVALLRPAGVRRVTTPTNLVLAESQARSARRRS